MKQPKKKCEGEVPCGADGKRPGLDCEVSSRNRGDETRDIGHRSSEKRSKVVDVRGKPVGDETRDNPRDSCLDARARRRKEK